MIPKVLFFIFTLIRLSLEEDPIVQLPAGKIRGREDVTTENKTIYSFQKVPYAAPPVGNLRFKPPQPHPGWDDIRETTHLDITCFQTSSSDTPSETEDCLVINIFTPGIQNVSFPVILYIHGGGFVEGSSDYFTGDRFVNEGVVFTSINYRLGPLGFLSTEDTVIPGNNGLKDQQFALRWVYQNIHLFGGDPGKITLVGESSGSASVAYQLLNQKNRDFLVGAILQSGSALSPWAYQRRAREIAFATAAILNSTFETNRNSQDLLDFLMGIEASDIDKASQQYRFGVTSVSDEYQELLDGFIYAPVIEVKNPDAFLTKKMFQLIQAENVVPVPVIIGINSEEGLGFYDESSFELKIDQYDENLDWLVPADMGISDQNEKIKMGGKIRDVYTGGVPFGGNIGAMVRYVSDDAFTRSVIKHANLIANVANTYFYQFSYRGSLPGGKPMYDGAEYVTHGEEITYMYCSGQGCDLSSAPESDQIASKRLVKLWSDFAKNQNPTPEEVDILQNVTWPAVSTENGDFYYLDIDENLEIRNHPKGETFEGWDALYDSLDYDEFDTY